MLEVEGLSRSGGSYTLEDRHSHAAAWGLHQEIGRGASNEPWQASGTASAHVLQYDITYTTK